MTKAPEVSDYARAIINHGSQILLPFGAGDALISFKSRWELASLIDLMIKQAIKDRIGITDEERERMWRMMSYKPNTWETKDIPILDELIIGERKHGDEWLRNKLMKMFRP